MASFFRILLFISWIAFSPTSLNVVLACFRSIQRCGEGNWGKWGPWIQQSCQVTCCGAVQYEARKRDCPKPRPILCRDFPGCQGDAIQSRTAGFCNEIDCPVSCVGVSPDTFLPDPCRNSSRYYYRCIARSADATKLQCDEGLVFNPNIGACFFEV